MARGKWKRNRKFVSPKCGLMWVPGPQEQNPTQPIIEGYAHIRGKAESTYALWNKHYNKQNWDAGEIRDTWEAYSGTHALLQRLQFSSSFVPKENSRKIFHVGGELLAFLFAKISEGGPVANCGGLIATFF